MKIKTKYLDEIEINDKKIIEFEHGLPGFSEEHEFVLLDLPDNDVLQILQSVMTKEVAFIVTNPHLFYPTYEFELEEHIVQSLEITNKEDVAIVTILTIKEPFNTSTINLKAPIILNTKQRKAKQFIINDDTFDMKAKLTFPNKTKEGE